MPLGNDAGIPSVAATCDAASVLEDWAPELSAQCEDPWLLLLEQCHWPDEVERDFAFLAKSYPALVARGEEAGLFSGATCSTLAESR